MNNSEAREEAVETAVRSASETQLEETADARHRNRNTSALTRVQEERTVLQKNDGVPHRLSVRLSGEKKNQTEVLHAFPWQDRPALVSH